MVNQGPAVVEPYMSNKTAGMEKGQDIVTNGCGGLGREEGEAGGTVGM